VLIPSRQLARVKYQWVLLTPRQVRLLRRRVRMVAWPVSTLAALIAFVCAGLVDKPFTSDFLITYFGLGAIMGSPLSRFLLPHLEGGLHRRFVQNLLTGRIAGEQVREQTLYDVDGEPIWFPPYRRRS
jgi:hypothetical protein